MHERSIDTDILCLLAKRLLHVHPTIRLVLMSATVAAALYQVAGTIFSAFGTQKRFWNTMQHTPPRCSGCLLSANVCDNLRP